MINQSVLIMNMKNFGADFSGLGKRASNQGVGSSNLSGCANLIRFQSILPRENHDSGRSISGADFGPVRPSSAILRLNRSKIGVKRKASPRAATHGPSPPQLFQYITRIKDHSTEFLEGHMERLTITIMNWDKHNPRKDYKRPTWFALSNRFLEDPDFFEFTPIELKAVIYLFCQASQKNSETFDVIFGHAKRVCDLDQKTLCRVIQKLKELRVVQITHESRTDSVQDLYSTDRQTNIHTKPAARTDFDLFAKRYPKPKGTDAEKRFNTQIITDKDASDLDQAITNYLAMLSLPENDWRRPKQSFAAFLGTKSSGFFWRDFIDPSSARPSTIGRGAVNTTGVVER